ncbi:CTAP7 [Auxenochlorella protothecoides x Auxenochlorella symbiontica]
MGEQRDPREVEAVEKLEKLHDALARLPEDARKELRSALLEEVEHRQPRKVAGLRRGLAESLEACGEELVEREDDFDEGIYEETSRTVPRWVAQRHQIGTERRPDSKKEVLRPRDEAKLPLEQLGLGAVWTPRAEWTRRLPALLPRQRDISWGIYANPESLRRELCPRWARRRPSGDAQGAFWNDVIQSADAVELTLMAVTHRPMAMPALRDALTGGLRSSFAELSRTQGAPPGAELELERFVTALTAKTPTEEGSLVSRLRQKVPDAVNQLVEKYVPAPSKQLAPYVPAGTIFIFTPRPQNHGLVVEVVTADPIATRKSWFAGRTASPFILRAFFNAFLGGGADPLGRANVGRGILSCLTTKKPQASLPSPTEGATGAPLLGAGC